MSSPLYSLICFLRVQMSSEFFGAKRVLEKDVVLRSSFYTLKDES